MWACVNKTPCLDVTCAIQGRGLSLMSAQSPRAYTLFVGSPITCRFLSVRICNIITFHFNLGRVRSCNPLTFRLFSRCMRGCIILQHVPVHFCSCPPPETWQTGWGITLYSTPLIHRAGPPHCSASHSQMSPL